MRYLWLAALASAHLLGPMARAETVVEIGGSPVTGLVSIGGIEAMVEAIEVSIERSRVERVPGRPSIAPLVIERTVSGDALFTDWVASITPGTRERREVEVAVPGLGDFNVRFLYRKAFPTAWSGPNLGETTTETLTIVAEELTTVFSKRLKILDIRYVVGGLEILFEGGDGSASRVFVYNAGDLASEKELTSPSIVAGTTVGTWVLRIPDKQLNPDRAFIRIE